MTEPAAAESRERVASALASLKEIVSIVMGLTLTNTVLVLITGGKYSGIEGLSAIPIASAAYSLVLVVNIIRFYHGNMRHLDAVWGFSTRHSALGIRGVPPKASMGFDFLVIFAQSMIFAVTSFYASQTPEFLLLFSVLLAVDLVWGLVAQQQDGDSDAWIHQRRWVMNNMAGLVAVLVCYLEYKAHGQIWVLNVGVALLAVNTVLDFIISWTFYFPTVDESDQSAGKTARP